MANEQGGGVSSFSMAVPHKIFARFFSSLKSCIPWRSEPPNVSRDFWMPDGSCRVCYECDAQFTVFFRKHHCRLCGRIFCARCTEHSIPAPTVDGVERESVRVCNFCYKQHEKGIAFTHENGAQIANADNISTSPTETSFTSFKSCGTANSSNFTLNSVPYSTGQYQHLQNSSGLSPCRSLGTRAEKENKYAAWRTNDFVADLAESPNHYENSISRSDDEDVSYGTYQSNSMNSHQTNDYYDHVGFYCMSNHDESHQVEKLEMDGGNIDANHLSSSPVLHSFDSQVLDEVPPLEKKEDEHDMVDEFASSLYSTGDVGIESVDFEKNALLWLPPEPEDEEDERESDLLDDDGDVAGEWGTSLPSRSFGSGESHSRNRSGEEHTKVMKNVVDGHFRALVSQLLLVENLPVGQDGENENWLEIITYLSWEAATLLKPDMSKGGGMDPGGYVKVKCIASGRPSDSMVIKGVVCKKNVAHRRMTSKIEKPRFMILGGALEYQRVSNLLSSFDTLLQQEMDHLKMAVAKIEAHHPDVLLVEKSVSRYAQDYLLAKDISLVLNIKRSILERISRCTGAQIVPSIDRLSSQELGYCDTFHVERFLEDLDSAGQGEKKLVKTLMFFEGCPKPLGCTILLRGACRDELKKVKHVIQYGIFAAYHLALETSFLADEGASLPELPFQSSIAVALPDKLPSSFERSISMVPGFKIDANGASQGTPHQSTPIRSISVPVSDFESAINSRPSCILNSLSSLPIHLTSSSTGSTGLQSAAPGDSVSFHIGDNQNEMDSKDSWVEEMSAFRADSDIISNHVTANNTRCTETMGQDALSDTQNEASGNKPGSSDNPIMHQDSQTHAAHSGTMNDEFPPSPADHQSILVSLSSRCVWKGTVCERSHRFRIKYYGSFDKPLGRFLRDHLFDQTYQCKSCEMPSEAHVHCYTHRQGTLTISVKRLPEIFLPGEREGKIWMWHRCLRCPRIGGFPPATQRIVMSDAAWGLSFGKFLELSFSNHAAASRVASCGHSLHRDCLRFYGFGKMVACFRYASIDIHSVYLPPSKLDFISTKQEWIQIETSEVVDRAELLFSEVLNALCQIEEKAGSGSITSGNLTVESRHQIVELEAMLQKEKVEFEELLQKTLTREPKKGQPVIDILEINRLRRQLFFQSYMWDHRLVYAASLDKNSFRDSSVNSFQGSLSSSTPTEAKPMTNNEKLAEIDLNPGKVYNSRDSYLMDALCDGFDHKSGSSSPGMNADMVHVAHLNTSNDCDEFDRKGGLSSPGINADMVHAAQLNMRNDLDDFDHKGVSNPGISSDMVQVAHLNTRNELKKEEGHSNIPPNTSVGAQSVPLTPRTSHHRVRSDGQLLMVNLSDTLETAWTGENLVNGAIPKERACLVPDTAVETSSNASRNGTKFSPHGSAALSSKGSDNVEDKVRWLKMPFLNFYRSLNTSFLSSAQKFDTLGEYNPVYVSSFRELELEGGARLLLPVGDNDIVIPVYDDEPTSLIAYALSSSDYKLQTRDDEGRGKENGDVMATMSFTDSVIMRPDDDTASETHNRSLGSPEESVLSVSGSRGSMGLDPLSYTKSLHARVSFGDDGPLAKVKYSVTCYYAKCFEGLRKMCCPSELDFVRSLSRCKKWGAEGGKSNVFFAKTLDDRFIIKQVTKTELESFIKFAPAYFKYVSHSISTGGPTCLAKILGIYQFTAKHVKGGKETKMDVLIMENLLFGRTVTRVYDLKGSSRSRYNPDSSGSNKVLLDQNLIETMPTSPIFVGNKAKRLLERAVWNDTAFLASVDVMDYSLLVGVDEEKHELVLGIIDFMRQYTWDKHLETWVKASGILGGPKNTSPTVISPKQYKKRFRKAMSTYFLMVLDQWSPSSNIPSSSQSDFGEEAASGGASVE